IPLLQNALNGKDPVLRAYAAAAYTLLRPQDTSYTTDVIRLYIFDPSLAARALNLVSATDQSPFKLLKQASSNTDEQVRAASAAWLSDLHTQQAAQQLLKMAKKEKAPSVQAALARGLAAQAQYTLPQLTKGLYKSYRSAYANTCALSLGFMTGNATEVLRQMLSTTHPNARINASRAAAYMANVLASSEGFAYSSDRTFDIHLLKGLIAPLNLIAQTGNDTERTYADNALRQIEKLME
ncbi:MAG: hypothetical protein MJ053_06015, partial [Elusimicrobiaceae bacterium]|nr:hypothetical protein [Elusimicrobiaceae bacterium]